VKPISRVFLEKLINKAFPEFSNKVTWTLITLGAAMLVMPAPTYLMLLNLFIDFYNKTAHKEINLIDIENFSPSSGIAITLIISGLLYHVVIKAIQLYAEIIEIKGRQSINDKKINADEKLFKEFLNILPTSSLSIELLKDHDFGASFHDASLKDLESLKYKWGKADQHFHDHEIEAQSIELLNDINGFLAFLYKSSAYIGTGPLLSIPTSRERAYDWDWPESTREKIRKANELGTKIYDSYCNFVSTTKRKLMI